MDVVDESDHSPGPALSIKAIDNRSVHRICSGQVVLTLATAVKELVENSIDAGATSIEVRLKDYGAELIEVADNGVGVEEANFAGLTLKHHTSKLREFSDLTYVDTFGFRGEALSSLCALSNLCIMTCHKDTSVGTKLEFNNNGHITSQTPCARQRGTTVSLGQLFHSLPVRHKEFNRNLKKEFAKMLHVLNGYCIISTGIRISCTNQTATNGKKTVIVSTNGNDSLKENITNIFGPKQYQSLLKFTQGLPSEQVCTEYNIKVPETTLFRVEGFVSSSEHGKGRGSSDRQYIFVNRRPCDLAKVTRVVNEVYHSYNRHQFPFVMLNIVLAKESVDVNVTPDKRQIFICEEKLLLAIIKTSLIHLFEPISSVYQVNQGQGKLAASLTSSFAQKSAEGSPIPTILRKTASSPYSSPKVSLTSALSSLKRSFSSAFAKSDDYMASDESPIPAKLNRQRRLDNFFNIEQQSPTEDSLCGATLLQSPVLQGAKKESDVTPPITDIPASSDDMAYSDDISSSNADSTTSISNAIASTSDITSSNGYVTDSNGGITALSVDVTALSGDVTALSDDVTFSSGDIAASSGDVPASHGDITVCNSANRTSTDEVVVSHSDAASACSTELSTGVSSTTPEDTHRRSPNECLSLILTEQSSDKMPVDNDRTLGERLSPGEEESLREEEVQRSSVRDPGDEQEGEIEQSDSSESDRLLVSQHKVIEYDHAEDGVRLRSSRTVPFSMSQLQRSLSLRQKVVKETKDQFRSFRAQISPGDNQAAEEELKKEMKKYMFAKMEILGQFNLGFIIAKLGSDLFIVDQHATDEKYNFEMLQQHTVIHSQKLIQPQKLELTAANTIILIDNIDIFKTNGFEFEINEEASLTERIKLTAMPVSKNWTFGKDDIEELIFMLSDSPGVLCRPSRVRLMFASRACRKSIMVGTALNNAEMRKVLNHMGEIEQPWNCPHGRPTMRHLINLDCLQDLKK